MQSRLKEIQTLVQLELIPGPMDLLNLSLQCRIESQDLRFPEALHWTWDQLLYGLEGSNINSWSVLVRGSGSSIEVDGTAPADLWSILYEPCPDVKQLSPGSSLEWT